MEHFVNIRKSIILSVLFLSVFFTSYSGTKTEVPSQVDQEKIDSNRNKIIAKIKDKFFDELLDYKFLDVEYKILAVKTGNILINQIKNFQNGDFVEWKREDFFEKLLKSWNVVESNIMVWQAAAFICDDFDELSYRRMQQVKLEILSKIIVNDFYSKMTNLKFINKLIKKFVPKKLYSKYKKIFELKERMPLDEIGDYFNFINGFLKKNYDFSLDEDKLDQLINVFQEIQDETFDLFLDNLLKIKYYNISMNADLDKAFSSNDSSKIMLVMNHHLLLRKNNFKYFLKDNETSILFNRYIDIVNFYLNNQDVLSQPSFIFRFFKFCSNLNDLKEKNNGIIPFINLGGNGKLVNVINETQKVLDIILKKIHEQMGTGPGWLPKLLLGKAKVPQEVINFAMKLLEEKVLSNI